MTFLAFAFIVVVSIIIGFAVQYFMKKSLSYEWLIVALAFAFGAYFTSETIVGSEIFGDYEGWGPVVEGMYLIPAIIGGALLAFVADLGVRTGSWAQPA